MRHKHFEKRLQVTTIAKCLRSLLAYSDPALVLVPSFPASTNLALDTKARCEHEEQADERPNAVALHSILVGSIPAQQANVYQCV